VEKSTDGGVMRVVAEYSFNGGDAYFGEHHPGEKADVIRAIASVDAASCKTKVNNEQGGRGQTGALYYAPTAMNTAFRSFLEDARCHPDGKPWKGNVGVSGVSSAEHYVNGYARASPKALRRNTNIDYIKNRVGLEVQLGKYAFGVYDVFFKMPVFRNNDHIECGIELVPSEELAQQMSSGVITFEKFVWELEQRGVSNVDVPLLVLGIHC